MPHSKGNTPPDKPSQKGEKPSNVNSEKSSPQAQNTPNPDADDAQPLPQGNAKPGDLAVSGPNGNKGQGGQQSVKITGKSDRNAGSSVRDGGAAQPKHETSAPKQAPTSPKQKNKKGKSKKPTERPAPDSGGVPLSNPLEVFDPNGNKGQGDQQSGAISGKSGRNAESSPREETDGGTAQPKQETSAPEQAPTSPEKKTKDKERPALGSVGVPASNPAGRELKGTSQIIKQDWNALYEKEKSDFQKRIRISDDLVRVLKSDLSKAEETAKSVGREKGELEFRERQLKERYSELESKHDETMKTWDKGQRKAAKLNDEYEKVMRENGELELRERHLKERYSELESKHDKTMKAWDKGQRKAAKLNDEYEKVRRENGELELRERHLKERYAMLESRHDKTMKTWEEERRRAVKSNEEYETAIASLRSQIDELTVSHIKSMNSIAPGLEPISQQTISESLTSLQHKIEEWARGTFNSTNTILRPLQDLDPDIDEILSPRIRKSDGLPVGKLMELVVWGYIEQRVMSAWFPTMSLKELQEMSALKTTLRFGDNSKTHERVDFWRSYTASLLFQTPQVHKRLVDTSDSVQAIELGRLLKKVLLRSPYGSSSVISSLQDIISSAMSLAAQLRCQRGVYDVDDGAIAVGRDFNDERMFCLNGPDFGQPDEASRAPVRAIVSNAVVWRAFSGVGAMKEIISKARVLVDVDTDERNESFHEAPTSPHSPTTE